MDIKTKYVLDRLAETPYERRRHIYDLLLIEKWVDRRPVSIFSSLIINSLRHQYPVDWRFILHEILHGHQASAEEVKAAMAEWEAKSATEREAERKEAEAAEATRRAAWQEAGGRP